MELAREQQVVRRAERLLAEVGEGEARDAAVRRRDFDLAGADAQRRGRGGASPVNLRQAASSAVRASAVTGA